MVSGWCLDGVWKVSGRCLERVWKVSGPKLFFDPNFANQHHPLTHFWRVSGRCLDGVWKVSVGVWKVSVSSIYCHTRVQLGISALLKSLQVLNLQVGPRSGYIIRQIFFPPAAAPPRNPTTSMENWLLHHVESWNLVCKLNMTPLEEKWRKKS